MILRRGPQIGGGAIAKLTGVSRIACFTAGTPVLMDDGTSKAIEQVEAGHRVRAWNPDSNTYEPREVVATYAHRHVATWRITTDHGTIDSTAQHPFHVAGRGWTPVRDLQPGDRLDGGAVVQAVQATGDTADVYNLHAGGLHTFQVATTTGTCVTVHNRCGTIDYGELDELGRPTGIEATITPDMIKSGSDASRHIKPPGFLGKGARHARGHLLGSQLGGSGKEKRNLVTLFQNTANHPAMSGFEAKV